MWGCAQMELWWIIALINGTKGSRSRFKPMGLNKRLEFRVGGVMPEIENFQDSAQHCFELAKLEQLPGRGCCLRSIRAVNRQRV